MKASFRFTVCLLALVLLLSSGLPGAMAASAPSWLPAQETGAAASDWAERMTALPAFGQVYLSWQPMQGSLPPAPTVTWEDSCAILRGLAAWGVAKEEMREYRWEESEDFGGYFVADESSSLLEDEIVLHVPSPRPQTLETPLLSCGDAFVSFTYWALSDEDGGYALDQVSLSLDGGDVVFYQLTISPEFTLDYYNPDSPWNRTSASYDAQGRLLSAQTTINLPSDDYWFEILYRKNPLQGQEYRFEYLVHDNVNGVYYACQEDSARQKLWTKGGTRDEITPPQSIAQMVEELPVLDILGEAKAFSAPDWMPVEQPQDALPLEDRLTPLPGYGEAYLDWQPMQGTLPAAPEIAFEDSHAVIRGLAAWGVTEEQMRVYNYSTLTGFMEDPRSPELEDEVHLNVSSQWLQTNVDTLSTFRFKCQKEGSLSFGYEYQPAEEGGEGTFVLEEVRISYEDGSIHFYDLASSAPAFTLYYYGDSGAKEMMMASYDAQGRLIQAYFSADWENGSLTMNYANCTSQMNAYGFSYIDISDEKNDARYRCSYSLDWRRLRWWSGFHDHGPDEITPPQDIADLVLAQPLPLVLIGQEGETYSVRADELFLYQHPE